MHGPAWWSKFRRMTSGGGDAIADLARLPGLEGAAEQLAGVIAIARAEQARQAAGAAVTRPAWKNLVFTWPGGAGKSRAAAAVVRAYRELGVLSSGHIAEVAAQDLATSDVLLTGQLVREAAGRGRGGVLMISRVHEYALLASPSRPARRRTASCSLGKFVRDVDSPVAGFRLIRLTGLRPRKCVMAHNRGGLLAQIERDVADHTVPLSSLLQTCIVLGGQAGSEKMRDWARQELHGYVGADTVPDYRHVPAAMMAMVTNRAGYNGMTQRIDDSIFPDQIREMIREKVDLEDAILSGGIGELEALASQDEGALRLIPSWSTFIADTLNQCNKAQNSHVAEVYWSVSRASVRGVLSRVRTALAELVAELITLTPQDQEVPDKQAADQVVQFVITGDRSTITYSPQHATGGGTNVTVDGGTAAGPVAVAGAHGSAIGSQTASGANSSVSGGQSVQAGRDAVTAGQDATVPGAADQPVKEGWWARLRKRGAVVAFATIIGALAGVAGVVIAIMVAAGWKP